MQAGQRARHRATSKGQRSGMPAAHRLASSTTRGQQVCAGSKDKEGHKMKGKEPASPLGQLHPRPPLRPHRHVDAKGWHSSGAGRREEADQLGPHALRELGPAAPGAGRRVSAPGTI